MILRRCLRYWLQDRNTGTRRDLSASIGIHSLSESCSTFIYLHVSILIFNKSPSYLLKLSFIYFLKRRYSKIHGSPSFENTWKSIWLDATNFKMINNNAAASCFFNEFLYFISQKKTPQKLIDNLSSYKEIQMFGLSSEIKNKQKMEFNGRKVSGILSHPSF